MKKYFRTTSVLFSVLVASILLATSPSDSITEHIYTAPSSAYLEILPSTLKNSVLISAIPVVTVRGGYSAMSVSSTNKYRIRVVTPSSSTVYERPDLVVYGDQRMFYAEEIAIGTTGTRLTTIFFEGYENGQWQTISSQSIQYDDSCPDENLCPQALWGYLANEGHHGASLKSVSFYAGQPLTFYLDKYAVSPTGQGSEIYSGPLLRMFNSVLWGEPLTPYLADMETPYNWNSENDIRSVFDDLKNAGANTFLLSWWGPNFDGNFPQIVENPLYYIGTDGFPHQVIDAWGNPAYANDFIAYAATYPRTCSYTPSVPEPLLGEYDPDQPEGNQAGYYDGWRYTRYYDDPVLRNAVNLCFPEYNDMVTPTEFCLFYTYHQKCNENTPCATGASCLNVGDKQACFESCIDQCADNDHFVCVKNEDITGQDIAGNSCILKARYGLSFAPAMCEDFLGTNDVYDQAFLAAAEKGLLVAPVIVPDPTYPLHSEIPDHWQRLATRIRYLLKYYGHHSSWLQMYDREGNARKVIKILGYIRQGNVPSQIEDFLDILTFIAAMEKENGNAIGFLLDVTPLGPVSSDPFATPDGMPPFFGVAGITLPVPGGETWDLSSAILGINPFNITTDTQTTDAIFLPPAESDPYSAEIRDDRGRLYNARKWLDWWYYHSNLPLIPSVIPGFNDTGFRVDGAQRYGDSASWHEAVEWMTRKYLRGGLTLDIWNGFPEGYAWTMLEDFNNKYDELRTGAENNHLARVLFWNDEGNHTVLDEDGDGVSRPNDNCPDISNPMVLAMGEVALGYNGPDDPSNGALFNPKTRKHTRTDWKFGIPVYYWQPDHDLDGAGDACDIDTAYATPLELTSSPLKQEPGSSRTYIANDYLTLKVQATTNEQNRAVSSTNRYCWITKSEFGENLWGDSGYCSVYIPEASSGTPWVWQAERSFGYSHGSEIEPVRLNKAVWQEMSWTFDSAQANSASRPEEDNFSASFFPSLLGKMHISTGNISLNLAAPITQLHWNWRRDVKKDNETYASTLTDETFDEEHTIYEPPFHIFDLEDNDFFFALSTGARDENSTGNYLQLGEACENTDSCNNKVNPYYFRLNPTETAGWPIQLPAPLKQFARSIRLQSEPTGIAYRRFIVDSSFFLQPPIYYDHLRAKWRYLGLIDFAHDPSLGSNATRRWDLVEDTVATFAKYHDEKMLTLIAGEEGITYGIRPDDDPDTPATFHLVMNYPTSSGDWRPVGQFTLPHADYELLATTQHDESFYAILKESVASTLVRATLSDPETATWSVTTVAAAPATLGEPTIHWIENTLFILGNDANGMKIYRLEGSNLVAMTSNLQPSPRDFYNAYAVGDTLYLAGGKKTGDIVTYPKDIWRYTVATGWVKLADNINADLFKTLIRVQGTNLLLFNQGIFFGNITQRISVDLTAPIGGNVITDTVEVFGLSPAEETNYCLDDNSTLLKGGTLIGGFCQPFTHPWYKQYSIGTTVYSVAGKGNRLYVGTGSAIKVYDISDPNALTLKYTFTTNRTVYDLEVADGDIMYAATSGGLYRFDTANPDTLTSLQFFSTPYNYQYRIQLYNDKLYVGDDNGINIRSTANFARLAYVNIGSTMDFAIANGELAMYWDSFWNSGIDIRNVDNLATRKAWDNPYCSTGELTTDHGAFYLSCDGYEYRFVGLPNTYLDFFELDGDMREMQENHLYNGWVYIPDGNKVKLSTNNEVPSICGNGIIEPGEFCDGNTEDCALLDPNEWDSGAAICNSTCTAWDTGDCYWSGC